MSVGQAIGGAIGAVAGFMLPGVGFAIGAQIGLMVGGYIDPPPGPHSEGPRLSDLTVQTSTYGAGKTRAYGTVAVTGNLFWLEGDAYNEHTNTQESAGKGGGGGATSTSYTYSATFAVALTEGQEITGIRRLWVGDRLIYDAGSDNVESIIASNQAQSWTLYTGADTQEAEPRMQADKGAANVSNYPGRAYIVFYDLDLTEHYSNSLLAAQVKAEVVVDTAKTYQNNIVDTIATGVFGANEIAIKGLSSNGAGASYVLSEEIAASNAMRYFHFGSIEFPDTREQLSLDCASVTGGYGYSVSFPTICQSDEAVAFSGQVQYSGYTAVLARWYYPTGTEQWTNYLDDARLVFNNDLVVFSAGETFLGGRSNGLTPAYIVSVSRAFGQVIKATATTYAITWMAVSENYLFAVKYGSPVGETTVYKFLRADLTLSQTYTQSVHSGTLQVVDDDTFYTTGYHVSTGNKLHKWVDGVVVEQWSGALSGTGTQWLAVVNGEQLFGYELPEGSGTRSVRMFNEVIDENAVGLRDIVTNECAMCGLPASDLDLAGLTDSAVRGYRVTGVNSPRAALEPLQAAWPFDVYQKGYKVGFKSRGGAAVATIEEEDLGAGAVRENVALLQVSREMETQIARTVTVKHLDKDRDYEIGEQTAPERPGVSSVEPRQVELPIVLTSDEAAQIADVLNAKAWTERVRFGPFSLPPTYAILEPTDVVTINHRGRAWQARLTRVEYLPDGRLDCDAVLTASAAYNSSASGASPLVAGQSLVPLTGSSRTILLDIPRLDSAQDNYGITVGAWGGSTAWPGAAILRSDDSGSSWTTVGGVQKKVEVFTATTALAAGRTDIIDATAVLTVTADYAAADLFSITEEQLFALQNIAAYGADGRWEIMAFKDVALSDGVYTLSGFIRGLAGSEWAVGTHQVGDKLILLDAGILTFAGLSSTAIGLPKLWKAVTNGSAISSAAASELTYHGVNLKPLAPIAIRGTRDPLSYTWTIEWTRRSRTPSEAFSGVDAPLGEASSAYEVEIYDAALTTLKRTLTGLSEATASYSEAHQLTDFGDRQTSIGVKVYQISAAVGRGYAATLALAPALPPYPALVSSNFTGTVGSSVFTTDQGATFTNSGSPVISSASPYSLGTSISFPATGTNYVYTPVANLVDGMSLTVEFWLNVDSYNGNASAVYVLSPNAQTTGTYELGFFVLSDGRPYLNPMNEVIESTPCVIGSWEHWCIEKIGANYRVARNGVFLSFSDSNWSGVYGAAYLRLGYSNNGVLRGKVADFVVYPFANRNRVNFTPPTKPH